MTKRLFIVSLLACAPAATQSLPAPPALAQPQRLAFEHITVAEGLPSNSVNSILQDHLGFLWFATQNGLVKYDGYRFTTYLPEPDNPKSISLGDVFEVLEDHRGDLWIVTRGLGLNKFDRDTETFTRYWHGVDDPRNLITNRVYTLFEDRDGMLWIGTVGEGLVKFDRETETVIPYRHDPDDATSLSSNAVNTIAEDADGILWVGTSHGLNKLDKQTGTVTRYLHESWNPQTLIHNVVTQLYKDRVGMLWVGTFGGLQRFDPQAETFELYRHDPNDPTTLSMNRISAIFEDGQGALWVGTPHRGLNKLDRENRRFTRYLADPNDPTSLSGNWVNAIYEDRSGVLWIGCWLAGLNKVDPYSHKFTHYNHRPGDPTSLSSNWVWALHEDRKGRLWIGTSDGLDRIDPGSSIVRRYRHDPSDPTSLTSNTISQIYEDRAGTLWIATHDGGLNKLIPPASGDEDAPPTFVRYQHDPNDSTSISHNAISVVFEDSFGVLWIGTFGGGLNQLVPSEAGDHAATFILFRRDPDEVFSLIMNRINVLFEDAAGSLWIGTDGGGLDRYHRDTGRFGHYYNTERRFDIILDIHQDAAGRMWVGTYNGGLQLFDQETGPGEMFTEKDGLPHNAVKAILEDASGNLWLSTERGLSTFNYAHKTFRNYDVSDGLHGSHFNFKAAVNGRDGTLYFGGTHGVNSFFPDRLSDNPHPPQVALTDLKFFNESVPIGGASPLQRHINTARAITLTHRQNDISIDYAALHFSRPEKSVYAYKLDYYDEAWREVGTQRTATYTSLDAGDYVFRVKAANSDGLWNEEGASLRIVVLPPFWQTVWFRSSLFLIVLLAALGSYRRRIGTLEKKRLELEERVKERTEAAQALEHALSEVERLKNRLQAENTYLQDEIKLVHNFENIITCSEALKRVLHEVEQVAATDATVLITGESGTGKELLARAIHNLSPRSHRPLVKVNCAALPADLIESELFGHEKGAFTGAIARKIGRFELADGGTLFLDEIGDLPLALQAKLLRVLQEGEFERLGNPKTISVDVRVIAATNRDLEKEREEGRFREDLYYRLSVFPIESPPLRRRKEDIPLLASHFVKKYNKKIGKQIEAVPQAVIDTLERYHWPGNVRELENVIERAVITSPGKKLVLGDWLPKAAAASDGAPLCTLEENERQHILKALALTGGRVSGEKGAARLLNINPHTLTSRMKKLGINRKAEKI